MKRNFAITAIVFSVVGMSCGNFSLHAQSAAMWQPLQTYTDTVNGVSFQYPAKWKHAKREDSMDGPTLFQTSIVAPAASFAFVPRLHSDPYAGTILEAVSFTYAHKRAADAAACEHMAASMADTDDKTSTAELNGRRYTVHRGGDASAGHSSDGYIYSTFVRDTCFFFETNFAVVSPGLLDDARDLGPHDFHILEAHLLLLMKTVQIKS